jgi:hypothetical protein
MVDDVDFIKEALREVKGLVNDVTTSDLQGIVSVKTRNVLGKMGKKWDAKRTTDNFAIDDLFLQHAYGELDINSAKRYIVDAVNEY